MPSTTNQTVRTFTREQAEARMRADSILQDAGLLTIAQRTDGLRSALSKQAKDHQREYERLEGLLHAVLQITSKHTEASLPRRLAQAARNDLHDQLNAAVLGHFGV